MRARRSRRGFRPIVVPLRPRPRWSEAVDGQRVGVPQAEGLSRLAVRSWRVVHHGSGRGDSGPVPRLLATPSGTNSKTPPRCSMHSMWSSSGLAPMEETRRRVQQEQLGHRGRKHDPLYRIRNTLPCQSRAAQRPSTRAERGRSAGRDPNFEVTLAWRCYQQLRSAYHTKASPKGRAIAVKIIDIPHLPNPPDRPAGPHPALKDQFLLSAPPGRVTAAPKPSTASSKSTAASHAYSPISTTTLLGMILAAGCLTHPNLR